MYVAAHAVQAAVVLAVLAVVYVYVDNVAERHFNRVRTEREWQDEELLRNVSVAIYPDDSSECGYRITNRRLEWHEIVVYIETDC